MEKLTGCTALRGMDQQTLNEEATMEQTTLVVSGFWGLNCESPVYAINDRQDEQHENEYCMYVFSGQWDYMVRMIVNADYSGDQWCVVSLGKYQYGCEFPEFTMVDQIEWAVAVEWLQIVKAGGWPQEYDRASEAYAEVRQTAGEMCEESESFEYFAAEVAYGTMCAQREEDEKCVECEYSIEGAGMETQLQVCTTTTIVEEGLDWDHYDVVKEDDRPLRGVCDWDHYLS